METPNPSIASNCAMSKERTTSPADHDKLSGNEPSDESRLDRRKFLGRSSSLLLAAALAGQARGQGAQDLDKIKKARQDASASDAGPENQLLKDASPNTFIPPITDHGEVETFWSSFSTAHRRIQRYFSMAAKRALPTFLRVTWVMCQKLWVTMWRTSGIPNSSFLRCLRQTVSWTYRSPSGYRIFHRSLSCSTLESAENAGGDSSKKGSDHPSVSRCRISPVIFCELQAAFRIHSSNFRIALLEDMRPCSE